MPRFFIDTDDNDTQMIDGEGLVLSDAIEARRMAIDALPDMARDKLPDGDRRNFVVRVRDESGKVIYSATLALTGEWHITPPSR